jgi:hypothetical protein
MIENASLRVKSKASTKFIERTTKLSAQQGPSEKS